MFLGFITACCLCMCLLYFKKRAQLWLLRNPTKAAEIRRKRALKKRDKTNEDREQMEWNWHGLDNITNKLRNLVSGSNSDTP